MSEQLFNPFNVAEDHEQFVHINENTDEKVMHQGDPHRS